MNPPSETAFVALGANLDDPVRQLQKALDALSRLPQTRLVRRSSLYRTAPVGVRGQPDFINAVAELETRLAAHDLLRELFAVEAAFGRIRSGGVDPRTLDLDLLLYATLELRQEGPPALVLPHPRMHLRAFVLEPLLEIAPQIAIPGRGSAAAWRPAVSGQSVEALR